MTSDGHIPGCELPEEIRLHYLDAMGISCWQLQQQEVAAVAETDDAPAEAPVARPLAETDDVVPGDWQTLRDQVATCTRCEQLCDSRTQTVFGTGDPAANVLVIGEAPGRDEDLKGEPFVGRAGQLLNAMLKAIGLAREQVYIANILKCRPPNNRDPSPQEAGNCSEFLQRQIELIQPSVIMVVGRIAAQNLLGSQQAIGKLRGRQHSWNGIPVIVTYHPAYLLRQPSEKRKSWQDLLQLKQLL